jgi:hypothetical protein
MARNSARTHPFRAVVTRDVVSVIRFSDGSETPLPQSAGERMFRRARDRDAFLADMNREHGHGTATAV